MGLPSEPMELLIDSANGIYCYSELAKRYPLYVEDGGYYILLETHLQSEALKDSDLESITVESVFHPDIKDWCENIEWLEPLYVRGTDMKYWGVQSIDGDIWAVHPLAEWDEQGETYKFPKEAKAVVKSEKTMRERVSDALEDAGIVLGSDDLGMIQNCMRGLETLADEEIGEVAEAIIAFSNHKMMALIGAVDSLANEEEEENKKEEPNGEAGSKI